MPGLVPATIELVRHPVSAADLPAAFGSCREPVHGAWKDPLIKQEDPSSCIGSARWEARPRLPDRQARPTSTRQPVRPPTAVQCRSHPLIRTEPHVSRSRIRCRARRPRTPARTPHSPTTPAPRPKRHHHLESQEALPTPHTVTSRSASAQPRLLDGYNITRVQYNS